MCVSVYPVWLITGQQTRMPEKKTTEDRGVVEAAGNLLGNLRTELEGSYPLRAICGICGLVMMLACGFGMLNIFTLITKPARFILRAYQMFFGLMIAVIEIKDVPICGKKIEEFAHKYAPFLTIIGGKGIFYAFAGSLGVMSISDFIIFVPSVAVMVCGVVLIFIHLGQCQKLSDKYNETIRLEQESMGL
eukprot:GHVO01039463.1.p1 GENE.GHVO01039463.1~~GHVO01039463.1.p1  ORF type:complete len:190 (+),score=33.25 GHVO01039463.1:399-968(+)